MKHMPLIQVDSDDEENEGIDSQVFKKVSNQNLHELLWQDRAKQQSNGGLQAADESNVDEDDWDLSLTLPHPSSSDRKCGCLPVPECAVS